MAQTIFCSQCGAKLNSGAKFCHSCGTKISSAETENIQNEENVDNSVSHRLHEQYESIIYRKVIDAYCEDDEIAISILYQNGVSYGFTHEMVDAVIKKQKDEINTFVNHLKDMYASDTMLIPDCSRDKENECVTFGENLGFCEEDAYEIYKAFMRQNKLEDKFFIITAQLAKYEHEGVVSDFNSIPECKNLDSDRFYIRFVKAIDKLREYQQSLHENSHSDSLNENDIQKIRKKAIELGFYDFFADADSDIDEDTDSLIEEDIYVIDMLITGNEIKLGFAAKANEKMFSAVIPFRTVTLLGKEVCFESSYFLNEYLKNTFFQHFNCQAKKLTDVLQEVAEHINHPQAINVIDNCGKIIESIWEKSFVALQDSLPLDRPTKDKLYQAVRERIDTEHLGVVDWELKQCSILFEEIDENVNDVKLEGKINQMCRGRWSGGGYGLSGAVKGAVAATVLDAGTGLLYSVANSISVSKAKSKSEERKIEVFQSTLNFLDMVLKALPKETAHCTYMFLRNQYTFSNSYSEEKGDKVYELYSKEKNEQRKNELALWDFSGYLQKETERLQAINHDADIKSRTAYGVLYDDVKEANEARKEMTMLTVMAKDNAELSMANRLFKIMQYNFKTNQAQSEIDERSKELMKHIEDLRNSVHRKSSALRFFLSLLATPIIACIGLAFSIPGIVIALIVIAAIWSVYHETRKECKAYNKEAAKKKQEIKEFENLFIVKNNRLIIKK